MFVTEKHDLYQTLMRLLLIYSRCRSALTQDFGIIRFQIVKGKNLYWSMYTVSCFLVCATKPPPWMYIHVHCSFPLLLFFVYKIYEGDTCSSGVFMVCFESSIIYLVKKILRRKGGTWLIKIVQNGKERIVTAITVFCWFNFPHLHAAKNFLDAYL